MKKMLLKHLVRTWKHHATMQVATLAVLAGTFSVVSLAILVHQNLNSMLTRWGDSVKLSVYLNEDINETQKKNVKGFLDGAEVFNKVDYISKEEAAKNFQQQMASFLPDLMFDEEFNNPLPSSYEAALEKNMNVGANYDGLVVLADKISKLVGVSDVSYGQGWVENYAAVVDIFSVTSYMLIGILLAGSLFVIGNSIRNSISQRREEIEVLELVGATSFHIRVPFIFEGIISGLIAGIGAILVSYIIFSWQQALISEGISFWTMGTHFSFLTWGKIFFLIFMGMCFGALGSLLCVRSLSTGWTAAERTNIE